MSRHWRFAAAIMLASSSGVSHAAWHEASSKHFVIYSNDDPSELRDFATKLEQFDFAVRTVRTMDNPAIAPSARLTVFVVRHADQVASLAYDRSGLTAGFYRPRSSGSIAVVPKRTEAWIDSFQSETVFFHEYAHHLMYEQLTQEVPLWFSEGFAEFFSTARFQRDGSIMIGVSPKHRALGVFSRQGIDYDDLLTGNYSSKMNDEEMQSLYGRGWLLAHYLSFEPSRKGQLADYMSRLAEGEKMDEAAHAAFGDLVKLERDVERYVKKRQLSALRVKFAPASIGEITIRPLRPGEAAVMPARIRSKAGVTDKNAQDVLDKVKKVANAHDGDPVVAVTLAEASLDAGDVSGAVKAADQATRLDPKSVEAKLFLGKALLARVRNGGTDADANAARAEFLAANKLEPEHAEPLRAYYESFFVDGEPPSNSAVAGLHYAAVLAPFDRGLRWTSAQRYMLDGDVSSARKQLAMLVFDPHGGQMADRARSVVELIDGGDEARARELIVGEVPAE